MFGKLTSKWWFKWLMLGIAIRLVLMPITLHPDLWGHSFTSYFFAYEGKLNPYEALANLPQEHPIVRNFGITDIFIYPPLTFFTLGIFRLLIKPFTDPNFLPFVMEFPSRVFERVDLFWNLFLFKLPYLFVDLGLAFILTNLFSDIKKKKLVLALWMLNPVTLYATFMIGQIDILPTFFTVLSLYFASKKRYNYSLLSLGLGMSYKMWPALLIIPAALIFKSTFWERLKLIVIGVLPFILSVLPFVNSPAFRYMVFSPKSQKMLYMIWPVTGAEGIYPFILILTLIYFYLYFNEIMRNLNSIFTIILLLIFSVTHYHPQWFLWVTPFLIVELVESNFKHLLPVLTFVASWVIITLFF